MSHGFRRGTRSCSRDRGRVDSPFSEVSISKPTAREDALRWLTASRNHSGEVLLRLASEKCGEAVQQLDTASHFFGLANGLAEAHGGFSDASYKEMHAETRRLSQKAVLAVAKSCKRR